MKPDSCAIEFRPSSALAADAAYRVVEGHHRGQQQAGGEDRLDDDPCRKQGEIRTIITGEFNAARQVEGLVKEAHDGKPGREGLIVLEHGLSQDWPAQTDKGIEQRLPLRSPAPTVAPRSRVRGRYSSRTRRWSGWTGPANQPRPSRHCSMPRPRPLPPEAQLTAARRGIRSTTWQERYAGWKLVWSGGCRESRARSSTTAVVEATSNSGRLIAT